MMVKVKSQHKSIDKMLDQLTEDLSYAEEKLRDLANMYPQELED